MSLLVVQHQETCPPGRVGEWLTAGGVPLDVRRPYAGESLPEDLDGHDGLLVLGGQMGCRDDAVAPWLPAVRELIVTAAKGATPTLGICLGHQLAAVALGGEVGRNGAGRTVGMLTVDGSTELAGDAVLANAAAAPVVQWNDDIVTRLPSTAMALATNSRGGPAPRPARSDRLGRAGSSRGRPGDRHAVGRVGHRLPGDGRPRRAGRPHLDRDGAARRRRGVAPGGRGLRPMRPRRSRGCAGNSAILTSHREGFGTS